MSDDLEAVQRALAGRVASPASASDTKGLILRRDGVVATVNNNGTVNVTVGGVVIPGARYKAWYTPVAGDKVFVEFVDTDVVVDGPVATASAEPGPWTSWTPTISQNGVRTITNTYARYKRLFQRTIVGNFQVTVTNAGAAGNLITLSLPVTPEKNTGNDLTVGTFGVFRAAGTRYAGTLLWAPSQAAAVMVSDNKGNALGIDWSFALANGDSITVAFLYEADSF